MGESQTQLIHQIRLENILSFGPDPVTLDLRPLNVLIGPNGSGKSNLIEAISLFRAAPKDLAQHIREGGGVREWIWKGQEWPTVTIELALTGPHAPERLIHTMSFASVSGRFEIDKETIEYEGAIDDKSSPFSCKSMPPNAVVSINNEETASFTAQIIDLELQQSILSQVRDPQRYPELAYLGDQYSKIGIYQAWTFGRENPARQPQKADERTDVLAQDARNLGLVLNRLRSKWSTKQRFQELLNELFGGIKDVDVIINSGTVQIYFDEAGVGQIPATRLSDGSLRFLFLLVLLCDPEPPPLLCIEEPELGLHPDAIVALADLLKEASTRTQLIVTTHSDILIDALTESPEDVVVCEKNDGVTSMRRLEANELKSWLNDYSLGQLWRRGDIGGNRW